jgi:hypothetical protein
MQVCNDMMHLNDEVSDDDDITPASARTLSPTPCNTAPALTSPTTHRIFHLNLVTQKHNNPFLPQKRHMTSTAHSVPTEIDQFTYWNGIKKFLTYTFNNATPNNTIHPSDNSPLTDDEKSDRIVSTVATYADLAHHNDKAMNDHITKLYQILDRDQTMTRKTNNMLKSITPLLYPDLILPPSAPSPETALNTPADGSKEYWMQWCLATEAELSRHHIPIPS